MNRREFIAGLGSAAVWPVAARAQQGDRVRRIGVLMPYDENEPFNKSGLSGLTQGLADLGWTEGRNVRMDLRFHGDDSIRVLALSKELVGSQPDIIVASATPATVAVQRETRTIPIVFANVADPVGSGLVASLNRPGGNITGFALWEASLGGKWLELLSEIAPGLKRVAFMFNPDTSPASAYKSSLETAARSLKVMLISAPVRSDLEIETAIIALGREPRGGLVAMSDVFLAAHQTAIISAAARNNVPAVYFLSSFVEDGGLLSYGTLTSGPNATRDMIDTFRRGATYVDRILRGEKPGDLPVQFPTKYHMAVNLKIAKALGLTIPTNLLALADEVIE
jgi:putative tryptophan/tyrosine transport system substrate-binding protein